MSYKQFIFGSTVGAVIAVLLQGMLPATQQDLSENILPEKEHPENKMNVQPIAELLSFTAVECGLAFEYIDHVMMQPAPTYKNMKLPCYTFNFYVSDNSLEMIRMRDGETWHKRAKVSYMSTSDVYLGNTVVVNKRCFLLSSYASEATTVVMNHLTQSTFAMLKPDVAGRIGEVVSYIEDQPEVRIAGMKLTWLTEDQAKEFYAEHSQRDFFPDLVTYVVSGPVLLLHLTGPDVVKRWREILGPTDSKVARQEAPSSLRATYGTDKQKNAAHGSDGLQAASRELSMFFPGWSSTTQLPSLASRSELIDVSSLLLLPHIARKGGLGKVLTSLVASHSTDLSRLELVRMSYLDAARYTTGQLLPRTPPTEQQQDQIHELLSGPSVALRVTGREDESLQQLVARLKDIIGPKSPAKARKAAVESLRAQFGEDDVKIGVLSPWFDWVSE